MSEEISPSEIERAQATAESAEPPASSGTIETPGQAGAPTPPPPPAAPEPTPPVDQAAPTPAPTEASAPPPPPAPPAPAPAELPPTPAVGESPALTPAPATSKVMDAQWPFPGYTGPQPWEADNTPELTQNKLMVSAGSAGPEVVELASLLGALGYSTTITTGQNPHAIYDTGVSDAVRAFCNDYGVSEDPKVLQARTADTVGPWIWEALVRAVHKKAAEQAQSE